MTQRAFCALGEWVRRKGGEITPILRDLLRSMSSRTGLECARILLSALDLTVHRHDFGIALLRLATRAYKCTLLRGDKNNYLVRWQAGGNMVGS